MVKCFFIGAREEYYCEYSIRDGFFYVKIDYDAEKEIDTNSSTNTEKDIHFNNRDIIVMDEKNNYLLKNAICFGTTSKYSAGLSYCMSEYKAYTYISNPDVDKLMFLNNVPKINKLYIDSDDLSLILNNHVVERRMKYNDDRRITTDTFDISYEKNDNSIDVDFANIRRINIGNRVSVNIIKRFDIKIHEYGCIELEFMNKINYHEVYEYLKELLLYLQLYLSYKISISNIYICNDSDIFEINNHYVDDNRNQADLEGCVNEDIALFIKKCYQKINYRNNNRIRNIYGIIARQTKNIEDDFLLYYRFIECYYKSKNIIKFLEMCIKEHLDNVNSDIEIKKMAAEITNLRNHYVHFGYHIKGKTLKIDCKKFDIDDYIVNNVDTNWIYYKTCLLYKISIDIIYKDILEYKNYSYTYEYDEKHKLAKYE